MPFFNAKPVDFMSHEDGFRSRLRSRTEMNSVSGEHLQPLESPPVKQVSLSWPSKEERICDVNNQIKKTLLYFPDFPDVGSSLFHEKHTDRRSVVGGSWTGSLSRRYTGDIAIQAHSLIDAVNIPVAVPVAKQQLEGLGTSAIAAVEPTNPAFSAATFLGELREGVPGVPGRQFYAQKHSAARDAGGELLNVEFGIRPIISDVEKLNAAVKKSDEIIRKYQSESGKKIHRKYTFPVEKSTGIARCRVDFGPNPPGTISPLRDSLGTISWTYTRRVWFSGAFEYYFPRPGDSAVSKIEAKASELRRLYGIEITPEVLWNLAPWSWAFDWFGNIGDVLHNISSIGRDGLVLRYGYVMCETKVERIIKSEAHGGMFRILNDSFRQRVRADKYGFAASDSTLSLKQKAIIAALGAQKLR